MLALFTLAAAVALADVPPPPPPDAPAGPTSSGDRRVGPFTQDTYPSEVMARPLALPGGMWRADASLDLDYFRLVTFAWSTGLDAAVHYGLTDRVELGAFAGLGLSPLLAGRRAGVAGTVLLVDGADLDLAVSARVDLALSATALTPALTFGVPLRLLLNDRVFLTFGADLLRIQLSPVLPGAAFNVGLGVQATGGVALTVETDVLKTAGQAAFFRQLVIPLELAATVAVSRSVDLRARAQVINLLNPRLAGTFALAGSVYF
ncbi:MAG TPA: hypothetical protein VND93_31590 [Myxococcales bacterium]|nr:hypothetical protein [Myxococcales bacterium]